ncbi:hypothetical protein ACJJIU_14270 [Microbulbifer sp. CnH-101-E]|uniref:hypothetical protein n=1 Tax=unclassified Microbulbifer TaxID=2619833 RepID=UPI00403A1A7B
MVYIIDDRATVQALELTGRVEGSIILVTEFIFALPIHSPAATGIVFPAQLVVGVFRISLKNYVLSAFS